MYATVRSGFFEAQAFVRVQRMISVGVLVTGSPTW